MGALMTGIRLAEMAGRAGRNNNNQQQDQPPPGSTPAPAAADCSREAAALNGMTEEQLQEFGQQMLEEACTFINRFSVLPSRAAGYALVLFAAHNWIYRTFTETPRMHVSALTFGAGKTRVMKLTNLLCPNPQMMAKITGPGLYHVIPERHPAPLGLDEADAIFGAGQRAEDIRGILNAGYEESGTITRVVKSEATDYNVFCPVMFAGKGKLPKSLEDRSITIMMEKRRPGQKMDRYLKKMHAPLGRKTGLMLGAWTTKIQGPAGDIIWDDPPEDLEDRQIDILTPFYAICEMAGGPWPERFNEIIDVLVRGGVSTDEVSPATALLMAIADVWPAGVERLATHELANLLAEHESGEFNWPEGQRTTELNARLRGLGIPPVPMRIAGRVMRGYERDSILGLEERNTDSVTDDHDAGETTLPPAETPETLEHEDAETASEYDSGTGTRPLPVSHDQLDDMARRANGRKRRTPAT